MKTRSFALICLLCWACDSEDSASNDDSSNQDAAIDTGSTSNSNCDNVCDPSVASDETAANVPAELAGSYDTVYDYAQTDSPFSNGDAATFEITTDDRLIVTIAGSCISIGNPVFRFSATSGNYTFKDTCDRDIAYNVSADISGAFNEVNVEPTDGPGWFGQFVEQ